MTNPNGPSQVMAARVEKLREQLEYIVGDFEKENPKAHVTAIYVEHRRFIGGERELQNVTVRVEF